jgi:hypothetical protein
MSIGQRQAFYWRAFVSFFLLFSGLAVAVSGSILYIAPPGRIANWSEWSVGALEKADWQAVHTIFAFLFVAMSAFHLYFNWRVIVSYMKSKLGEGMRRKWELALSGVSFSAILVLTLGGLPPFGTVMTTGEKLKNSWATTSNEPPVPHAEAWTLAKLSETMKVPIEEARANLASAGMPMDDERLTLADVGKEHGVTAQRVYTAAIGSAKVQRPPAAEGGGWGQKTIGEVCEQQGIPVEAALARLRDEGIQAVAGSNIRTVALDNGRTPIDLVKLLEVR